MLVAQSLTKKQNILFMNLWRCEFANHKKVSWRKQKR